MVPRMRFVAKVLVAVASDYCSTMGRTSPRGIRWGKSHQDPRYSPSSD
jgi:hypothetical protein